MAQGPSSYPVGQAISRLDGMCEKLRTLQQTQEVSDATGGAGSKSASIDAAQQIIHELLVRLKALEKAQGVGEPLSRPVQS